MDRTIRLLLTATPEQLQALNQTAVQFTDCFNHVCEVGWYRQEKNGVELHHATYKRLREQHPKLVADLHIQARVKATEALTSALTLKRKGKQVRHPCSKLCAVRYNSRTFRVNWKTATANLSTIAGRIELPFSVPQYAQKYVGYPTATADLIYRNGRMWLHIGVDVPAPTVAPSPQVIGVDLGINRPAVTSDAQFLGERRWKNLETKTFRLKRALQSKGTKSAKRHLRQLKGKQLRRRRDHDHVISKRIVQSTPVGATIALENLKNIRGRAKQRKGKQQRRLHAWSFHQLAGFIEYKTHERGIRVVYIDPRNTSKACSCCGHTHRSNRKSQSVFRCKSCGFELNADLNGARNVRLKFLASVGKSDASGSLSSDLSSQPSG
jgi:IS605 OrfB family transposase